MGQPVDVVVIGVIANQPRSVRKLHDRTYRVIARHLREPLHSGKTGDVDEICLIPQSDGACRRTRSGPHMRRIVLRGHCTGDENIVVLTIQFEFQVWIRHRFLSYRVLGCLRSCFHSSLKNSGMRAPPRAPPPPPAWPRRHQHRLPGTGPPPRPPPPPAPAGC